MNSLNEQLQQLADDAEDYADGVVDIGGEFHAAYTKKLCELIVKRCCDVLYDNEFGNYEVKDFYYVLKEHFGIE